MLKIIGALVVALLGGTALLYIEYCWFDSENCSFQASRLFDDNTEPKIAMATVNHSVPFSDCKKSSFDSQGVDDCEPINPLAFKINYLYQNGGKGDFQPFGEGSVLHSGDSLKLLFKPTEAVYVYIFRVDSHGNIGRLFPTIDLRGAANRNPMQKGLQYFVPAHHKSFRLDRNTGQESLYFIATRQAEAVLEQQYQKLFIAQQEQAVENITLIQEQLLFEFQKKEKQRLIEPKLVTDVASEPISFEESGERFSVLPAYLNNLCEGCVYRVTFKHDL
jgi:hypothetical protein